MKAEANRIALYATFPGIKEAELSDGSQISRGFSPIVYTDEARIVQVLLNLQSNALKFTK